MSRFIVLLIILLFFVPSISRAAPLHKTFKSAVPNKTVKPPVSQLFNVTLDNVKFTDLIRLTIGDILKVSFVLDKDVSDSADLVSVNWINVDKDQVYGLVSSLSSSRGFAISNKFGVLYFDLAKFKPSSTEIVIYRPKFRPTGYLLDLVTSVFTDVKSTLKRGVANPQSQPGSQPVASSGSASAPAQSLPSVNSASAPTSVLSNLDRPNTDTIVLEVPLGEVEKVNKLLSDLDVPVGEVLIHAVVYEVSTTKGQGGALALVSNVLKQGVGSNIGTVIGSGNSLSIGTGQFALVLSALDADSRFKTITRPSVRVRSGSQAKFTVGQSVPVLGSVTLNSTGSPTQSINYQSSGDIMTVTPDVHSSVIDLDITQEISSFVATTTGVNGSPTLMNRSVVSSLSVKSGEMVVIAGLTVATTNHTGNKLFGFNLAHEDDNNDTEIVVLLQIQKL